MDELCKIACIKILGSRLKTFPGILLRLQHHITASKTAFPIGSHRIPIRQLCQQSRHESMQTMVSKFTAFEFYAKINTKSTGTGAGLSWQTDLLKLLYT